MASAPQPKLYSKSNISEVGQYKVDLVTILGAGAYGMVHPAYDGKGNKVATKKFHGTDESKLSRVTRDLDQLCRLDHPNIVKIFDVIQIDTEIWMFMELCPFGDLNKFFQERDLNQQEKLELMTEIAKGVEYLHSQNVIHRDIKPGNILVANDSPIHVKLTDFDLSKFLEENYDTSLMTENVGTERYKAPEFYRRDAEGNLNYHRDVDIFAMGLMFLAISQKSPGSGKLVPRIETLLDSSELYTSIGLTLATRIRYKEKELGIIKIEEYDTSDPKIQTRKLIQKMTCHIPQDRIAAGEVVCDLTKIAANATAPRYKNEAEPDYNQSTENSGSDMFMGKYTVDFNSTIGSGAFGFVYCATDAKDTKVAAKMIVAQDKNKMRLFANSLDILLTLDHPNIVKIFDIHQVDDRVWMFMEFCKFGDLRKFFHTHEITESQKLNLMQQIAQGVQFLHANNIIHRDIKPANILIASDEPIVAKLTDFDFSKFFDEDLGTSMMSTDVGTLVFKAPEFYQRNKEGDIKYNRNVDIFAMGLTYLAMIQGERTLVPAIETPMGELDVYSPIGQILAERIRYGVKLLEVVPAQERSAKIENPGMARKNVSNHIRELIRRMTHVIPEERISATDVVLGSQTLSQEHGT